MATNNNPFKIEAFALKGEPHPVSSPGVFHRPFIAKLIKAACDTKALSLTADRLIAIADHALDLKQTEMVEQISQLLTTVVLPREYRSIGDYYHVFSLKRRGEIRQARAGFQRLAEAPSLPLKFRARAIQALGASYRESGQHDEAVRCFIEASRAASTKQGGDLLTTMNAQIMLGVYQSMDGDHQGALQHLLAMRPLVGLLEPQQMLLRYFYTNALAVELGELGRLEEARHLAESLLRSPYARFHTEGRETYDEIMTKLRGNASAVVARVVAKSEAEKVKREDDRPSPFTFRPSPLALTASNVVALPRAARPLVASEAITAPQQPARVIAYHGWQRSLPAPDDKPQESLTYNDLDQMSIAEKQHALLEVIYSDHVTHHTLDQLLTAAGRVRTDVSAG